MTYPLWQNFKDRANQSAFVKRHYSILRNRMHGFVRFFQMAALYGVKTTVGLYRIRRRCRKRNSLINRRLLHLANSMADENLIAGSATKKGWLYHDFPLPENDFLSHRKNSLTRIRKISRRVPIYRSRVLDLGCSSGGISIGMALLGASKVIGVDYDSNAVALAKAAAEKYAINNVEFNFSRAEAFDIPQVDVIVWLSNWMWIVQQHGMEAALDLLFDIPRKAQAQFMVFESAADDGKAAIRGTTQTDIEHFLRSSTPYTRIENIGAFKDAWRRLGQERMVFVCSEPRIQWQGKGAVILRNDRFTVTKTYEPQYLWARDLESECLQRLAGYPHFPNIIDEGDCWIKMQWAGNPVRELSQVKQLGDIVAILSKERIIHRDICLENLLFRDDQLYLIDFGWAIVDGQEPPMQPKKGLGRGFYTPGDWDDARAAEKITAYFKRTDGRHNYD